MNTAELVSHYAEVHNRLRNGTTPPKPEPERRPKSPFSLERRRIAMLEELKRLHRLFPKVVVEIDEFGAEILPPSLPMPEWRRITLEVCAEHRITLNDIRSARRDRRLVDARHHAWFRLRNETLMSYPEIGRHFNRDHTTILHGVQMYEVRIRDTVGAAK